MRLRWLVPVLTLVFCAYAAAQVSAAAQPDERRTRDAPEDTDVATVLMMGGVPCYVATRKYVYLVDAGGDIKYLTTTDVFTRDKLTK